MSKALIVEIKAKLDEIGKLKEDLELKLEELIETENGEYLSIDEYEEEMMLKKEKKLIEEFLEASSI